jgi:predicted nucleic acid-binding protein
LVQRLNKAQVVCHPFIIGELACGNLHNRATVIGLLEALPTALAVGHEEVLAFIVARNLMGKRLGYTDVHLLASALLTAVPLWTLDKRLDQAAAKLGCRYDPKHCQTVMATDACPVTDEATPKNHSGR